MVKYGQETCIDHGVFYEENDFRDIVWYICAVCITGMLLHRQLSRPK